MITFILRYFRRTTHRLYFAMADDDHVVPSGPLDEGMPLPFSADPTTWHGWFEQNVVLWAVTDPWGFLRAIFMVLTPFFILSGVLSYILMKDIEKREKDKKRKSKKDVNTLRARGKHVKSKNKKTD